LRTKNCGYPEKNQGTLAHKGSNKSNNKNINLKTNNNHKMASKKKKPKKIRNRKLTNTIEPKKN